MVFASNVLFDTRTGLLRHAIDGYHGGQCPEKQIGVASRIYKMGGSLGGAMGIAVTASHRAVLPLGMAHAAQYALV